MFARSMAEHPGLVTQATRDWIGLSLNLVDYHRQSQPSHVEGNTMLELCAAI